MKNHRVKNYDNLDESSACDGRAKEKPSVGLRPRRIKQSIGADGEIETFRGDGMKENNETGNLPHDVSFEEVPEVESDNDADLLSYTSNQQENNIHCPLSGASNNGCDCVGAQSQFSPIELPRTGGDNGRIKHEKRISIESVDANYANDNESPLTTRHDSGAVLRSRRQETIDDVTENNITIIDNAVVTRKQSKNIKLWIKGENIESDSTSEDSEISFKCSPTKHHDVTPRKLNFHCDCGLDFTRRSSLTLHRKGSKCPIKKELFDSGASACSDSVHNGIDLGTIKVERNCLEEKSPAKSAMSRLPRSSLPGTMPNISFKDHEISSSVSSSGPLRNKRSIAVEKDVNDESDHDASLSIAELLDSLTPADDDTVRLKGTKKRPRSLSDTENNVNNSKKSKLSSPRIGDYSKRDKENDFKSEKLVPMKNGNVLLPKEENQGCRVVDAAQNSSLLSNNETKQQSDNAIAPVKRGRGRPRKNKKPIPSDVPETPSMESAVDNVFGASKTIAQEMIEAIQTNLLNQSSDVESKDRDVIDEPLPVQPVVPRKRGRPRKMPPATTPGVSNTNGTEEDRTTFRNVSSGSVSTKSSSSSVSSLSRKVTKVRRRTEEFVKKSIARAKANLSSVKEGKHKMFTCTCGLLYTQKQSVMRHQQNSKCPLQRFSDIKYVFVDKFERTSKERKFVCSCGRKFTQSSSMQRHQKNSSCPFLSAAIFTTGGKRKGRKRKSTTESIKTKNDSDSDEKEEQIVNANYTQSTKEDSNNSTESEEELVSGKRVDYSLKASYICTCKQTFKFHGSIRRHQKHSKCVGFHKVSKENRRPRRSRSVKSQETKEDTRGSDNSEQLKEQKTSRHHSGENMDVEERVKHIKEDPDAPKKDVEAKHPKVENSSSAAKRKRISVRQKIRSNNTSSQSRKNAAKIGLFNAKKPIKRLQRQSNVPGYYFPCQCGRKYRHKRDLCTHQRRSETCPRNSRDTIPVYYSWSKLKRTSALILAKKEGILTTSKRERKASEGNVKKTPVTRTTNSPVKKSSSLRKRTPSEKQGKVKLEESQTMSARHFKRNRATNKIERASLETDDGITLDVRSHIKCKCGSNFTRLPSLRRHWRECCTSVTEKDKQRISRRYSASVSPSSHVQRF